MDGTIKGISCKRVIDDERCPVGSRHPVLFSLLFIYFLPRFHFIFFVQLGGQWLNLSFYWSCLDLGGQIRLSILWFSNCYYLYKYIYNILQNLILKYYFMSAHQRDLVGATHKFHHTPQAFMNMAYSFYLIYLGFRINGKVVSTTTWTICHVHPYLSYLEKENNSIK